MGRGEREMGGECSVNGSDRERLLFNHSPTFDIWTCYDGSRELIPAFHNRCRKYRPSTLAVARTLEYLVGVPP